MRKLLLAMFAMAVFMAFGTGSAMAQGNGGGGGDSNACPPQTPGFPDEPAPGCGLPRGDGSCFDGEDNDGDGRKDRGDSECRDETDGCENGAPGCPSDGGGTDPEPACDTSGPVSSIVQQISDEIRAGGGAPLADVIDTINCEIIVGVLGLSGPDVGI